MWWILVACSVPSLEEGEWTLGEPLPGLGAATQPAECDLSFRLAGAAPYWDLDWPSACGRADLPDRAIERECSAEVCVYNVGGNDLDETVWMSRPGDHPELFELWVYISGNESLDAREYDAEAVIPMWATAE